MEIKLKAIPPISSEPIYKASIHKTGKIGLSIDTAKHYGFDTLKSVELLINDADTTDTSIYAILRKSGETNTYKINKAGNYHTVNSTDFFDTLKIDYKNENIVYSVSMIKIDGQEVLKFEKINKTKSDSKKENVFTT